MATTRRSFLQMALAPAALGALGCRPVIGAPAIIKPEITPQQFGAKGGDAAADTLGWNRAIAAAAESGRPVMAKGTYVLRVPAASGWNWRKREDSAAHVAVQLKSGVKVYGSNVEILVGKPERPPVGKEHHFLFGTELNMTPGAIKNVRFEGINIDFREEFGVVHRPTYAFGLVGIENFERHNLVIRSSGERSGRGLLCENSRNRIDRNLKFLNLEQGIYTHYENGVTMDNVEMDGFNEGFDFDGPAWDVNLSNLKFRNASREAQCIDTGGGARWMVSNIDAENTGAIIFIYNKSISWPTYEQWYKSDDGKGEELVTPDFVISEDMTIRNVRGRNVGKGLDKGKGSGLEEVLRIGSYRTKKKKDYFPGRKVRSPRNITIEDWQLDGTYRIAVSDCENLTMRNITMNNVKMPDDAQVGAALVLREPADELGGVVTGTVSDIHISGAEGMAVSVVAGSGLKVRDITVKGFNLGAGEKTAAAVRVRHRPGGSTSLALIENVSAEGGPSGVGALDIAATEPEESTPERKSKTAGPQADKADKAAKNSRNRDKPNRVPTY